MKPDRFSEPIAPQEAQAAVLDVNGHDVSTTYQGLASVR
jgi:hypothetical protein